MKGNQPYEVTINLLAIHIIKKTKQNLLCYKKITLYV